MGRRLGCGSRSLRSLGNPASLQLPRRAAITRRLAHEWGRSATYHRLLTRSTIGMVRPAPSGWVATPPKAVGSNRVVPQGPSKHHEQQCGAYTPSAVGPTAVLGLGVRPQNSKALRQHNALCSSTWLRCTFIFKSSCHTHHLLYSPDNRPLCNICNRAHNLS